MWHRTEIKGQSGYFSTICHEIATVAYVSLAMTNAYLDGHFRSPLSLWDGKMVHASSTYGVIVVRWAGNPYYEHQEA